MTAGRTIFISGWAHDTAALRPLAAALGTESAEFTSPAELLAECSTAEGLSPYAAALAARLRNSQDPVALVGWSTGGMIALEAALALPEKVSRLVLVSAAARFCATDGYACGLPAGNLRALAAGVVRAPEAALKGFFELAAAPTVPTPDEAAAKVAAALAQGSETLKHGLAYLRDCDLRSKLAASGSLSHWVTESASGLACTLIHGREDRVIPYGASEFLAAAIPVARLVLVDGAGHDLPLRSPQQVAAAIGSGVAV
jgi:pimeloyl-[acyl-carrier protein] methyl ester esterase